MKLSRLKPGQLFSIHSSWFKILFILLIVSFLFVFGTIQRSKWGVSAGSAASAPQKFDNNATGFSATPTPMGLIQITETVDQFPPLPEVDSLEFDLPPLPDLQGSMAEESEDTGEQQRENEINDLFPFYWGDFSQAPYYRSACFADLNKRSLIINLAHPFLSYEINLIPGQAWVYHKFWLWNQAVGIWESGDWTPPYTQVANFPGNQYIFSQKYYVPEGVGVVGGSGGVPLVVQLPLGTGETGPYWVAIERYIYLSRLNNQTPYGYTSWVYFTNGGTVCGYDFSGLARSDKSPGSESLVEITAPTPPADSGSPNFAYLPVLRKPGTYSPAPTTTPFITPTVVAPPTPVASPIAGNLINPNFDQGPDVGWEEYSSNNYEVVMHGPKGFSPRSGQFLAWLGGAHDDESRISQTVTIPNSHPFLTLYLMATSEEDSCAYDKASIMVDEYQVASIGLCKQQNFHAWLKSQIDLRDFAGQTVTLKIQVETDGSQLSSLFVDDLVFESGVLIPTLAPTPTQRPNDGTIRNPDFELRNNGDWVSYSTFGVNNIFLNNGSHSGSWLAWLGGLHNEIGYIDQTLNIPPGRPYLTYWGWISSYETVCSGDRVSFLAGNSEVYEYPLCTAYNSTQWGQGWVNLSAYAGTTQRIRIQVQTNGALNSSLYLDDFVFAATPPTAGGSSEPGGRPVESDGLAGSPEEISPEEHTPDAELGSKESIK